MVDLVLSLRPLRSWMTRRGMNATHQMKRSISHHHQPMKSHQRQPCPRCVTALVFVLVFVVLPLVSWKSCTSTFSLPHFGQVMMLPPSIVEQAIRNHEELCKLSMDADACFFCSVHSFFSLCAVIAGGAVLLRSARHLRYPLFTRNVDVTGYKPPVTRYAKIAEAETEILQYYLSFSRFFSCFLT